MKGLAEDDPSEDVEECLPLVDWRHWMVAIRAISTNSSGDYIYINKTNFNKSHIHSH